MQLDVYKRQVPQVGELVHRAVGHHVLVELEQGVQGEAILLLDRCLELLLQGAQVLPLALHAAEVGTVLQTAAGTDIGQGLLALELSLIHIFSWLSLLYSYHPVFEQSSLSQFRLTIYPLPRQFHSQMKRSGSGR